MGVQMYYISGSSQSIWKISDLAEMYAIEMEFPCKNNSFTSNVFCL
jgi:hypothetical protein